MTYVEPIAVTPFRMTPFRVRPRTSGTVTAAGRRRGHRLVVVAFALVVLRAVEAAVTLLTAALLPLVPLDQPDPHLDVTRLAKVQVHPDTATTALVMVAVASVVAVLLLRTRSAIGAFAGVKAVAVLAATAITGMFASGSTVARVTVTVCGACLVLVLWPSVRAAVPRVLNAAGVHRISGRTAEIAIMMKIILLVAIVVLLG